MKGLALTIALYLVAMDGFVFLLTGESLHHSMIYKSDGERIGSQEHLERQDREEWERIEALKRKYAPASER